MGLAGWLVMLTSTLLTQGNSCVADQQGAAGNSVKQQESS
jgi:hypothetical protein